jgi:signal transduction histidine kinase
MGFGRRGGDGWTRPLRRRLRLTWPPRAQRDGSPRLRADGDESDVRIVQDAIRRLAVAPAELVVGREPPAPAPGRGRFARLRRYRRTAHWLMAAAAFLLTTNMLVDESELWDVLILVVAALIALPLGLAASTPLNAWRLQVVVVAAVPVIVPPAGWIGPPWPAPMVFIALYVTLLVTVRVRLPLLAGVWVVTSAAILWSYLITGPRRNGLGDATAAIVLATLVVACGYLIGTRRRLHRELVEGRRREQEQQARSSLLEERARIARELHDVVAHHMSIIAVRAETAPYRIPGLPAAAKDDMAETSAIAREALTEMRRLLGVLRGAGIGAALAPQPGMDGLEGLIAAVRGAGLPVDVRISGTRPPLPAGVALSAYRILQEALSNVLRHASGARATVEVGYEPDRLRLRIHNDPPPAGGPRPPGPPGHGIIGMRERAAMLDGTLTAGPTAEGGYLVEADLSLTGAGVDHAERQ